MNMKLVSSLVLGLILLMFVACFSGMTLVLLCVLGVTVNGACSCHPALAILLQDCW